MRKIPFLFASLGAMLAYILPVAPVLATQSRSFVSSSGSGTACTRAAPCADFQTAHDATTSGGTVFCVDPGDYSGVFGLSITKSITIDCTGTQGALTTSFSVVPIEVNGGGIRVILRGLSLQGKGTGHIGIEFINGAELHVDNCRIAGFHSGGFAHGISFRPPDGVTAKLYVMDSMIENNGQPTFGGGIIIQPAGSGSARVTIERTRVEHNTYGIFANGMGTTGLIAVQIRDSVASGNLFNGISAFTAAGKATTSVTVDRSSSTLNGQAGILAQGANGFVLLATSTVIGNVTGLSTADGGNVLSYQNNQLTGNVTDGAPTGVLTVQ